MTNTGISGHFKQTKTSECKLISSFFGEYLKMNEWDDRNCEYLWSHRQAKEIEGMQFQNEIWRS